MAERGFAPTASAAPGFNPRASAVALAYHSGEAAPQVVAKGRGLIAQEIIQRARDAGVYVHESPELVGLLMDVDLDARIPPALYVAVAELLAWLYSVEQARNPVPSAPTEAPAEPLESPPP